VLCLNEASPRGGKLIEMDGAAVKSIDHTRTAAVLIDRSIGSIDLLGAFRWCQLLACCINRRRPKQPTHHPNFAY
jgi:hypothetical protein